MTQENKLTYQEIIPYLNNSSIDSKWEQAIFLGQADYESSGFTQLSENLNYSKEALLKLFPKYFTEATAEIYGRTDSHAANQIEIANEIYNGRMGNQIDSNDGWNYRGGGLFQLTGKDNYAGFAKFLKSGNIQATSSLTDISDFVRTNKGALLSAIYFWHQKSLSLYALKQDILTVSKIINFGSAKIVINETNSKLLNLAKRTELVNKYLEIL